MQKNENTGNKKKQIVLIIVSIVAIIGTIIFATKAFKEKEEPEKFKIDGIDIIEKDDMFKDRKIDSLDITNQVLYNMDDMSSFSAMVENNSNTDVTIKSLYVVFKINNEEKKLIALKNTTIKANEKRSININFDSDISEVSKIDYIIEK